MISFSSYGLLDNIPCGTDINAIINEKLETIEQDHTEYIKVGSSFLLKKKKDKFLKTQF